MADDPRALSLRTLVLCGGKGTRAYPHTAEVPKPLLDIGGRPILWHVMEIYRRQGFNEFVLAGGHLVDQLEAFAATTDPAVHVEVLDTGADTGTGGRVWRCRERLSDRFLLTYGDGVGNVDLHRLLEFHQAHGGIATITTVPLPSPYGTLSLAPSGRVEGFIEKARLTEHPINAGFMVMEQAAFDRWAGEDLERDVLPALAAAGELYACHHPGFWRSMDTYKEAIELSDLCAAGSPPWLDGVGSSG